MALAKVWTLGLIFKHCNTVCAHFCYFIPCCFFIVPTTKINIYYHTTLVSPSLCWTSAPIQFTIVFGVLGTQETFLLFACRVVWERPSSSYASHGLINPRSSTWGNFATVLQTSALGGPTTSTRRRLCSRHHKSLSLGMPKAPQGKIQGQPKA